MLSVGNLITLVVVAVVGLTDPQTDLIITAGFRVLSYPVCEWVCVYRWVLAGGYLIWFGPQNRLQWNSDSRIFYHTSKSQVFIISLFIFRNLF